MKKHYKQFKGSVDDFLAHVSELDANLIEKEINDEVTTPDEDLIDFIMGDWNVDKETAQKVLQQIKLEESEKILNELKDKGIVEVVKYDENQKPMFGLTEKGKLLADQIKKESGL